jgi:hypothetical protein
VRCSAINGAQTGCLTGYGIIEWSTFREEAMGNPKIALAAYCLAVGFTLAVAFHPPSTQMVAASEAILTPAADRQWSAV